MSRIRDSFTNLPPVQKFTTLAVAAVAIGVASLGAVKHSGASGLSSVPVIGSILGGESGNSAATPSVLDHSRPRTRGLSGADYDRIGQTLDNPDAIFQQAHYQPVWTSDPQNPSASLPKGCTVIPHESRTWEPWFRNELKNGDKVLSTGDLLMLRDNIVLAVANDPRTQFRTGTGIPEDSLANYWATRINQVRKEVMSEFGVDKPSLALEQVTIADATTAFVKSQRNYGRASTIKYFETERIWPTAGQMLNNNLDITCMQATSLDMRLIRTIESQNVKEGIPTGIEAGGTMLATRYGDVKTAHGNTGVRISLRNGKFANLYYDGMPRANFKHSAIGLIVGCFGPMDKASMEKYADANCMYRVSDDPRRMGLKPAVVDGTFQDGENWKCFYVGNYVPYFDGQNGRSEKSSLNEAIINNPKHEKPWIIQARWEKEHQHPNEGFEPWQKYYDQNSASIVNLNQMLDRLTS